MSPGTISQFRVSHYKILEKLGEGGMGVVYKAQDLRLDRGARYHGLDGALNVFHVEVRVLFLHSKCKSASLNAAGPDLDLSVARLVG